MTIQDTLHELAEQTADLGDRDLADVVERAWVDGARRRRRSGVARVAGAALVVAALVLLVVAPGARLGALFPAGARAAQGITAYPQRVGHQWFVRDEDGSGGPASGLLQADLDWYVVRPSGELRALPPSATDVYPTLSADGRYLGYLTAGEGPYVVRDLAAGTAVEYPVVGTDPGAGSASAKVSYGLSSQYPSWFAADGRLVLSASTGDAGQFGALVLSPDGTARFLPGIGGLIAGWLSDREILTVTTSETSDDRLGPGVIPQLVHLHAIDVVTGSARDLPRLRTTRPFAYVSQWSVSISPDRSLVSILDTDLTSGTLSLFRPGTGEPVAVPGASTADDGRLQVGESSSCALSWQGATPAWFTNLYVGGESAQRLVAAGGAAPLVVVDPYLGATCLTMAPSALGGSASWTPFGRADALLIWWWQEIVAAVVVVGVVVWFRRWRSRRKGWEPAVRGSWRAGLVVWRGRVNRRQRVMERVALVAIGVLLAGPAIPWVADRLGAPGGYPQRIGVNWSIGPAPSAAEQVAGLLLARDDTQVGTSSIWYSVTPDGGLARLTEPESSGGRAPAISPDGSTVAYLLGNQMVIQRVDGTMSRTVPAMTGQMSEPPSLDLPVGSDPPRWAADSQRVAIQGQTADGAASLWVFDVRGAERQVRLGSDARYRLVGWTDSDTVVVVTGAKDGSGPQSIVGIDVSGASAARSTLAILGTADLFSDSPLSVSPDGRWLESSAAAVGVGETGRALVPLDGTVGTGDNSGGVTLNEVERHVAVNCPVSWSPTGPVYTQFAPDGRPYVGAWTSMEPLVAVDGAVQPQCLILSTAALDAGPRWTPFGTLDTWLVWNVRWVLLAIVLGAWVGWLVVRDPQPEES